MELKFQHTSEYITHNGFCAELDVTFEVIATSHDDYSFECLVIYDGDKEIELCLLPAEEQAQIENMADKMAWAHSDQAYREYCDGYGDYLYDCYKQESE